jgi:hypothetical protein
MAFQWKNNPEKWFGIGCRQWQCPSTPRVYYQRFESGVLFGVFRSDIGGDAAGLVYVLLNKPNKHWATVTIETSLVPIGIPTRGEGNCTP